MKMKCLSVEMRYKLIIVSKIVHVCNDHYFSFKIVLRQYRYIMLYSRRQYNLCEGLLVVCRLDNIQFVLNTHILNHDVPRYTTHTHIVYLRFKLQKKKISHIIHYSYA